MTDRKPLVLGKKGRIRLGKNRETPQFRDFAEALAEFEKNGGAIKKAPKAEWVDPIDVPTHAPSVIEVWRSGGRRSKRSPSTGSG
jgi:hypothetical protein